MKIVINPIYVMRNKTVLIANIYIKNRKKVNK